MIGKNFLDGIRQGRLQKAAQAEMENEKVQRAHEFLIDSLSKNESLDPRVKQHYLSEAQNRYAQMIAGVKETSKDTGHPLTDMLKNMAINLTGGQLPKKGAGLDTNFVSEAFSAMHNPAYQRSTKLGELTSRMSKVLQDNNLGDFTSAMKHPAIQSDLNEWRLLADKMDGHPELLSMLPKDETEAIQKKYGLGRWKQRLAEDQAENPTGNMFLGGQPGIQVSSPPPIAAGNPETQGQPAISMETGGLFNVSQPPPAARPNIQQPSAATATPAQQENWIAMAQRDRLIQDSDAKLGIAPNKVIPDTSKILTHWDPVNKKRFDGIVLTAAYRGNQPGIYDAATGRRVEGAERSNNLNPDKQQPLTPEQSEKLRGSLYESLNAIPDAQIVKSTKAAIDAQLASGDHKGAGDTINRAVSLYQAKEATKAAQALAQSNVQASRDLQKAMHGNAMMQQFVSGQSYKNMDTAENYANNAQAAYSAIKRGEDPGIYDLELLRTWSKLTDITTGVREGEYRDLAKSMGMNTRQLQVVFDNILNGTGKRMDDKMRDAVMSSVERIRSQAFQSYDRARAMYDRQAQASGIGSIPGLQRTFETPDERKPKPIAPKPKSLVPGAPAYRRSGASAPPPAAAAQSAFPPL